MPEIEVLGKRLKAYRCLNKETQEEFAEHVGISMEEVSNIERCNTDPRLSTIQKIAAYMGETVSDLLEAETKEL